MLVQKHNVWDKYLPNKGVTVWREISWAQAYWQCFLCWHQCHKKLRLTTVYYSLMWRGVCDSNWIKLYKLRHKNVTLKRTVVTSYHFMTGGFKVVSHRHKFNYGRFIFKFLKIIFLGIKIQQQPTLKFNNSPLSNLRPLIFRASVSICIIISCPNVSRS